MRRLTQMTGLAIAATLAAAAASVPLDGEWTLAYRHQQEKGEWRTLPAAVPGNVHLDLQRAGIIADPMVGTNVFGQFWIEQCEWRYSRTFPRPPFPPSAQTALVFDGVDTRAEYLLNGERLGESANMFLPQRFDVTGRLRAHNTLEVRIASPLGRSLLGVLGRNRVGGTDVEGIRKAQHSFGWDIMPRVVTAGIWKGVRLETVPEARFADVHWFTTAADPKSRTATVTADCHVIAPWRLLHAARLRFTLARGGRTAFTQERTLRYLQTRDRFALRDVDLWWPRDAGEPALYDATVELVEPSGRVCARDVRKIGLKTVRLERADWHSEEDPGTFRFIVNGEPIYMHGTDWTPMDALHARDPQHLERCLAMLTDLNCNMIRIWGGGVYEADRLYDFCDANGILVWQDFMLGNVQPEQNAAFAQTMYEEARHEVVRLRSHASLALWCGNNEIDRAMTSDWGEWAPDPEGERISREVFPRVLRDFDPFHPYLPSSPLWTPDVVAGRAKLSQDHLWGPRAQFHKGAFWTANTPTFVSETGYHGCPNVDSLRRMMTPANLYPWKDAADKLRWNDEWVCKAVVAYPDQRAMGDARNSLMVKQVKGFFGAVPDDLEAFSRQSQIVQAEALKYWMELSRARKGRMWGLLWWNLRDGWPIISDGVVDYYFGKKRAYGYLKQVQGTQLATVVEDGRLAAVNDRLYPVSGTVKAVDAATGRTLYDAAVTLPANGAKTLAAHLPLTGQGMVRIDYVFENVPRINRCLYGTPPFRVDDYERWAAK